MIHEPAEPDDAKSLPEYFPTVTIRADEHSLTTRLDVRDDLRDGSGALRVGAVTYAVDIATGIASGVAVQDRDMWTVTTDLDVHMTAPVSVGPLRVDAEVLRSGATTAVAAFLLHDEGDDRNVGGGTATFRPFPVSFDASNLKFPIGVEFGATNGGAERGNPISAQMGFRTGEDGSVEVDIDGWLRNPWGILHGGVTACLIDVAAEFAGSTALGRPVRVASEMVRFLSPARVGPVRGLPRVLAVEDGRALVEVRVRDQGADDRLVAVSSLTAAAR